VCPVLIQDARRDPAYAGHPAVRLGLTRYLGVTVHGAGGNPIGTLCFLDHRTEEPLTEADVQFLTVLAMRASAELQREELMERRLREERQAAAELASAHARLLEAAAEKRRFITAVIHDLRQPIATLRTLLFVGQSDEGPAEREQSRQLLEGRVRALGVMVDELLEYAQLDAGELAWHPEHVDLAAELRRCAEELLPEAEVRGVRLTLDLAPELGSWETDRTQLACVVRNLLTNSIKFSAHAEDRVPEAFLRARRTGKSWNLEVEDNGIGIPWPVLRRIFVETYRAPEASAQEERAGYPAGRGLGLAIVKRLCDRMGGRVAVRSTEGQGTRFRIRFPSPPL
jgi:two-component system sensor histidine kinase EvgS